MSAQKHKPGSFLGSLLGLIGFSAVAGLLVGATMTPALAVVSSTANAGVDLFENLPAYATINQQVERNTIWGTRDGQPEQIAQFYSQNREVITWQQVPDALRDAVVSAEDRRFYDHGGVDAQSIIRAAVTQITGSDSSGGSTLTMQLVRQQIVMEAFMTGDEELMDEQYDQSYSRKLKEMKLAIGLEQAYTKDEILLAYLNIANFGRDVYGVQAAAQRIFGVDAAQLTVAQSASLIATVQNPSKRSLFYEENWPANQDRRDWIIRMMATEGYITGDQRDEALATPVDANFVHLQPDRSNCIAGYDSARFFCDYVRQVLVKDQVDGHYIFGSTDEENRAALTHGGYDIYTSIDLGLNDAAQATLDQYVPNTETRWQSGGAVMQIEVGTGRILTMAQNKDYDNTEAAPATATGINFNTDYDYGGSTGFQPGSGYKIFTLAAWIEAGHSVNETLNTARHEWRSRDFTNSCDNAGGGDWNPQNNAGTTVSSSTVVNIMVNSLNTGVARMASQLDLCDIAHTAAAMGVQPAAGGELETVAPSVIGSGSTISPMSMAEAFQTVANGGVHCQPTAIDSIVARDGSQVQPPVQDCQQAISPEVASIMQYTLLQVTAGNPLNNPAGSTPVISKTGTSNNVVQTWVNGASPTVATSVWIGNIVGSYSLQDPRRWNLRSTVFTSVMEAAIDRYPGGQFLTPDQQTLQGDSTAVPDVAGMSTAEAQTELEGAGFAVSVGSPVTGAQASGAIEYSSPGAGASAAADSLVTIYPSDGSQGATPESSDPAATDAAVTWPDVSGQSVGDATTALTEAGATDVSVTWVKAQGNERCTVLSQDPEAGSSGEASGVTITVGAQQDGQDPGC